MAQRKLTRALTAVAVLFHIIGLVGIGLMHSEVIGNATPIHLLLMFGLLCIALVVQEWKSAWWVVATFLIGFTAEWIGTQTGFLFGDYTYGTVLGVGWQHVPLLIGANWVVVLAGSISVSQRLTDNKWAVCLLSAAVATGYDWVLEPVAIRLGYWQWTDGVIPMWNYLCWAMVSAIITLIWQAFKLRPNQFALFLFIIQLLFFIILRMLL